MRQNSQRGSAIVMIFIAIALFAALAYAFMQGSRTSTSFLSDEEAKTYATQIIDYGNTIKSAVKRLTLRGCSDTQISLQIKSGSYDNTNAPSDKRCHVFNIAGGGIEDIIPSKNWLSAATPTVWNLWFNGETAVQDIGTSAPELIMWITDVKPEICKKINTTLNGFDSSPETIGTHTTPFSGSYSLVADGIGDDVGSPYKGKVAGCMTTNFYIVLISR